MSVTTNEVNYLIWRYLQETGLEVSAFALQDETRINDYDTKYKDKIPIGCLVNLLQKGILYSQEDQLIKENGELLDKTDGIRDKFNLFSAINNDIYNDTSTYESEPRFRPLTDNGTSSAPDFVSEPVNGSDDRAFTIIKQAPEDDGFIRVLEKTLTLPKTVSCHWNPFAETVLAYGKRDSTASIVVLTNEGIQKEVVLKHPMVNVDGQETKDITAIRWSPKGNLLITGSLNGQIRVYDAEGKLKGLDTQQNAIAAIKWSHNGSSIMTIDIKGNVAVMPENRSNVTHYSSSSTGDHPVYGIDACWIDDGKIAIPGDKYSISIYNVPSLVPIGYLEGHNAMIGVLTYNDTLKLLASGSDDNDIRIWVGNSSSSVQLLRGHTKPVVSLDWLEHDADYNYLVSTSIDGTVRVWDVKTGSCLIMGMVGIPIFAASVSPDLKWLCTGDAEGTITIWDVSSKTIGSLVRENKTRLKSTAEYQPDIPVAIGDHEITLGVSTIEWDKNSSKICVSYPGMDSIIVNWR